MDFPTLTVSFLKVAKAIWFLQADNYIAIGKIGKVRIDLAGKGMYILDR